MKRLPSSVKRLSDLDCYLVGGAVRDKLLGFEGYDRDWVVVGATPELMQELGFLKVGLSFPVFLHPENHDEYALARTERKSGVGYKGFDVDYSQEITLEQDLFRRDLTVNAMAEAADGTIIDPFGGRVDLQNRVLRHVSNHFAEDPLRVLRVARFAARYYAKGFRIHPETLELMRHISESGELQHLAAERIWQEVFSALAENHPSIFFKTLKKVFALSQLFPELQSLSFSSDHSKCNFSHIDTVDASVEFSSNAEQRFLVLMYCLHFSICHARNDKGTAAMEVLQTKAVSTVRKFCNKLKVPTKLKKLAVRVINHAEQLTHIEQLQPNEVVDVLRQLNAMNNRVLFSQFIDASQVVLLSGCVNAEQLNQQISRVYRCRDLLQSIDYSAFSKHYAGAAKGIKIKEKQVLVISDFFEFETEITS